MFLNKELIHMKTNKRLLAAALAALMLTTSGTAMISSAEETVPVDNFVGDEIQPDDGDEEYEKYYPEKNGDLKKKPAIEGYSAPTEDWIYLNLRTYVDEMPDDYEGTIFDGGYTVFGQMKIDGKWKNVGRADDAGTYSAVGFEDYEVKPYTTYTVRAYFPHYRDYWRNKDGFKAYTKAVKIRTKPAQVKIKSTSRSKTAVRLNWKKVKCKGYKIQQYDPSNYKKWKTVATVRDQSITSARISKLKSGTKYKFRVIAYGRTLDKYPVLEHDEKNPVQPPYYTHTLWGRASKTVSVTTKK